MKKIFLIILISLTLTPLISKAQDYTLIEPLPCIADTGNNCSPGETIKKISLNTYIDYVFKFSIALAAFLAVVMIIFGGFQYMTSEVPGIKSDGKDKIKNAIFGLIMILASYLILQTIDPRLVEVTTEIAPIAIKTEPINLFANQLANELDYLSLESVREVENIKNANKEKQDRIDSLQARLDDHEADPLTEAELVELEKLKVDVKKGVVRISQLGASAVGQINFAKAYEILYSEAESSLDTEAGVIQLKDTVETIGRIYDEKIADVSKTDVAEAERLRRQKNFYLDQIKEEQALAKKTNERFNTSHDDDGSSTVTYDKTFLNAKLAEYKNALAHPEPIVTIGISLDQYTKMMQARIDLIEKTLKKK